MIRFKYISRHEKLYEIKLPENIRESVDEKNKNLRNFLFNSVIYNWGIGGKDKSF